MDNLAKRLFEPTRARGERLLFLLSRMDGPASIAKIKEYAIEIGFREISKWNVSDILRKQVPLCILKSDGWILTPEGDQYLAGLGYFERSPIVSKTRGDLESHAKQIVDSMRRGFAQEAVACFNNGLHRACVVLSWVGAIWIIENHIVIHRLSEFNSAGTSRFKANFRKIISVEHFTRMQEVDVLQLAEDIGLFDKSMKNQLIERLNFRNTCGHPNMVVIDDHSVAHHVEFLLNNVYKKF